MHTTYLGFGSNIGERRQNLRAAVDALAPQVRVLAESSVYETPPWGDVDQPAFLNMVLQAETELSPTELLEHIRRIEADLGRQQTYHWGPRRIDIDILLYEDLIIDTPELVIPHPRLHQRGFVLLPLETIAGEVVHPALGLTVRELLQHVDTSGIVPV